MNEEIHARKAQLRKTCRAWRRALRPEEKQTLDAEMAHQFLNSALYAQCEVLFLFMSLPQEPNTRQLISAALMQGKGVALPRCTSKTEMQFFALSPNVPLGDQCAPGAYGILEPVPQLPVAEPYVSQDCLCLVPGLAYDRHGGRLGYGAGYYDRYFARYGEAFRCTLGYIPSACVADILPMEENDHFVDGIVTEQALEVWYGRKPRS